MRVTKSDYLTVEVMNFVLDGLAGVKRLLGEVFDVHVSLALCETPVEVGTVPFPKLINALERDLDKLAATGFDGGAMQERMTWYGEFFDRRRLDYTDVNRWLQSIELMNEVIASMAARWVRTSGSTIVSVDINRQLIRSVR